MTRKQELNEYLYNKQEALEFWTDLRGEMQVENKISLLKSEIAAANKELDELLKGELN